MFTRRSLVAFAATTPFVLVSRQAQASEVLDNIVQPLELTDIEIVSISPDAKTLMGIQPENRIALLDAETLETVASGDEYPDIALMDRSTIKWSPNSRHFAFSRHSAYTISDSDIYVVDASTAEIRNLTAKPGASAATATPMSDVQEEAIVDMYPAWLDDSTVLFARTIINRDEPAVDQLMTFGLTDDEPDVLLDLATVGASLFASPLFLLKDGRIIFQTFFDGLTSTIAILSPDGELTQLELDGIRVPLVFDASETHLLVDDIENFLMFLVPLDNTDDMVEVAEYFASGSDIKVGSFPVFGPEPDSVAILSREGGNHRVVLMRAGERHDLGAFAGGETNMLTIQWEAQSLLAMSETDAWIMPVVD